VSIIDDALMFTTRRPDGNSRLRESVAGVWLAPIENDGQDPGPPRHMSRSLIAARTAMAESRVGPAARPDGFVVVHLYPSRRRRQSADDDLWNAIASRTGGNRRDQSAQRPPKVGAVAPAEVAMATDRLRVVSSR